MKKITSIILSAILLVTISITAFATDINQDTEIKSCETAVTLSVEPTYTVTIPSIINLAKQVDKSYAGSGMISTSAVRLAFGTKINILMQSDFEMTTPQGAKQNYIATIDGTSTAITNNQKVAEFSTSETQQSVKLNFTSTNPQFAGDYSDTVTFSISVK